MNVPFRPIISSLLRNRAGAMLVAVQVAITLAVLVNAVYIVKHRVDLVSRPTGIDDENIFVVGVTGFTKQFNYTAMLDEDIRWLASVPGVIAVTAANSVPVSGSGSSDIVKPTPDAKGGHQSLVNYYQLNEQGADALGLRILAGRWFKREEVQTPLPTLYSPYTGPIVVIKRYADRLFPNGDALGKVIYGSSNQPLTIVGIADNMLGYRPTGEEPAEVMYMPLLPSGPSTRYLVRAKPGMRDQLMRKVEAEMAARNDMRAVSYVRTLSLYKARNHMKDRNMAIYLVVVTALLLAITSLGIFALATFNVTSRTKQVGTRRAVGARRRDVVAHFLVENWIITTAGVLAGCVLALAAGHLLALEYELPRVDLYYIIGGVLVMWLIGVAAAWHPSRRASRISPALATRTV
ncbi:MAG: FtsX-like permease family protein [Gammaproteobacteria bacterium]